MRVARPSLPPFPLLKLLSTPTLSLSLRRPSPSPSAFSAFSHRLSPTLVPWLRSPILARDFSGYSAIFSGCFSRPIVAATRRRSPGVRVSAMSTGAGAAEDSRGVLEFSLSASSFLKIQKGDITQWCVDGSSDAIVNAANEKMLGGGGVDGAIHRAAGPELKEACYKVPEVRPGIRCPTGEARITPGFKLPVAHVIHTVGPIYDAYENPEAILKNAYRNSLLVAKTNNIQYVAFPAISCGVYRYPLDEAASIAISTVKEFANDFKEVHFVLFSDDTYQAWQGKANEIVGK